MAWYAKFDGVDGRAKVTDGTSNMFNLAEMDSFSFVPERKDSVPLTPASVDMVLDVLPSAGPNAGARGFFLTKQPTPIDYNIDRDAPGDMIAVVDDAAGKPSLVVKLDIGGPSGLLDV